MSVVSNGRSMAAFGTVLSLVTALMPMCCQVASRTTQSPAAYAIFSPDVLAKLPSLQLTPLGTSTIKKANSFLSTFPRPMPHLHVRHLNEATEFHDQSNLAQQDWEEMLYLGLAYRITADKQYLDADVRYFEAWADVFKPALTDLDPIDQAQTEQLIMAYDLVRDSLPAPIVTQMNALFKSLAEGYTQWASAAGQTNNLQSHAVELSVLAAYEVEDPELRKRAAAAFAKQVSKNVEKDGSVVDWHLRDALHYVDFDLKPLATAAFAARMHGDEWLNRGGKRSIAHAVEWLIPYATGELQHREFIHTTLPGDAHQKEKNTIWKTSKNAQDILGLAASMDPRFEASFQRSMQVATYPPGILVRVMSALATSAVR